MPPDALRGREHLLPAPGRALDVACGRGTVAVWLARRGFGVDAVDVSPVGLAAGAALAASLAGPAGGISGDGPTAVCPDRWAGGDAMADAPGGAVPGVLPEPGVDRGGRVSWHRQDLADGLRE